MTSVAISVVVKILPRIATTPFDFNQFSLTLPMLDNYSWSSTSCNLTRFRD
jgi:hypothetical protein